VEVKTAGDRMKGDWGEEWSDDIPQAYLTQVQHYLGVTGLDFCHVAVLFGGHEFRIYEVKRNEDFIKLLFEREINFWNDRVVPQIPPSPDGSESAKKMLDEMYPADTGATVEADGEIKDWAAEFDRQRKIKKVAEEKQDDARNHIVAFMGEAAVLTGPDFRITYKTDKPKVVVDYKMVVAEMLCDPVFEGMKGEIQRHLDALTETKPGSRRFLAKFEE
jgi:predicted phage-related endonuclease